MDNTTVEVIAQMNVIVTIRCSPFLPSIAVELINWEKRKVIIIRLKKDLLERNK